ncbi:MAG: DUF1640 domain-containing protein [Microthrixaceae bacterium]
MPYPGDRFPLERRRHRGGVGDDGECTMALSERSRSVLYHGFMSVVDDEAAVQEMMAFFPARDLEEPVTRDHLHAELADLRIEMAELRTEFAEFRTDMRSEMDEFRTDMRSEMDAFRNEIRAEMDAFRTDIRTELGTMRTEFRSELHKVFGWNLAAFVSMAAVIVAAVRL